VLRTHTRLKGFALKNPEGARLVYGIPRGYPQLMGFKGGFSPLAGLGAQCPDLYPLPDPPLKGRE